MYLKNEDIFRAARAIQPRGPCGMSMHEADAYARDVVEAIETTPEMRALAAQAVLDYFDAHPEAGKAPHFNHRAGIANAVLGVLFK